jgi:hypothetical protein
VPLPSEDVIGRAVAFSVCWLVVPVAADRDRVPPVFAGIRSATTCIPGPVGGDRTGVYHLKWSAARDAVTRQRHIVYDVYQATRSGGELFDAPTYVTRPGATTFATPPLAATATFYFVVRARDAAGNRDRNRREQRGINLCY